MRRIISLLALLTFFCNRLNAQSHIYSQTHFNGSTATAQCAVWDAWRAALTPGLYLKCTMSGTNDPTGITCTDPTIVNQIAAAIKAANGTPTGGYTSPVTNGHTWSVCNRYNGETWIDMPGTTPCNGANCPSPGYIMRPCITNLNWGGVNTATCGAPTQVMTIEFWYGYPCNDTPKTIILGPGKVCPNRPYTLKPEKFFANATYSWQYSFNGSSWSNYTGSVDPNSGSITDSTNIPKYYRVKISCNANTYYYVTPPFLVPIAPFYYCYCVDQAISTSGLDIGNVKVVRLLAGGIGGDTLLNKGNPLPLTGNTNANRTYSGFQDSAGPIVMYRDSTYQVFVSQITSTATTIAGNARVYIDFDRDGVFDPVAEKVMGKKITNPLGWESQTFTVPATANIGLTGMRIIIRDDTLDDPCGAYAQGETEDYLVDLRYEPCSGKPNAGKVDGDTAVCVGYDYLVIDTTYEAKKSDIKRSWQVSGDNVNWFGVVNSTSKDSLQRVFTGQPLYYRMQVVCDATHDTSYSASSYVNQKVAYKCYCYSQAIGGVLDSSDIGGYSIAGYSASDGGTHLDNPKARRKRTDHTDETPIVIDVDSNYQISTYHIMRGSEHSDAKITIFMDFNNNHVYDLPEDRIFTGFTSVGNFTLLDVLTVPRLAIMNVPTGMRVILNNDIGPNIPSDEACGGYTSGETEDYMVIFQKKVPTSINDKGEMNGLSIYPNPTTGRSVLQMNTSSGVKEVRVTITNVTGQKVKEEKYSHKGGQFVQELDMSGQTKGVYFVEVTAGSERQIIKLVVQ